jgi:hypothetical protein
MLISPHMLHLNQKASSLFAFDFGGDDLCVRGFHTRKESLFLGF